MSTNSTIPVNDWEIRKLSRQMIGGTMIFVRGQFGKNPSIQTSTFVEDVKESKVYTRCGMVLELYRPNKSFRERMGHFGLHLSDDDPLKNVQLIDAKDSVKNVALFKNDSGMFELWSNDDPTPLMLEGLAVIKLYHATDGDAKKTMEADDASFVRNIGRESSHWKKEGTTYYYSSDAKTKFQPVWDSASSVVSPPPPTTTMCYNCTTRQPNQDWYFGCLLCFKHGDGSGHLDPAYANKPVTLEYYNGNGKRCEKTFTPPSSSK